MKDSTLFIIVGTVFIQLGLWLPFYLYGTHRIPFGLSFLADGAVLLFIGLIAWGYEYIEKAKREDYFETWVEVREVEL